MQNLIVLPMGKDHIEGVYEVFTKSLKVKWSLNDLEKELENRLARYFVAVIEDKVVGFGGMWVILDEGHITNVAVHPQYRRNGIGKSVFTAMYNYCLQNEINALTLEVRENNISAQTFYTSLGFGIEGRRKSYYSDTKEDAIIMWNRNLA